MTLDRISKLSETLTGQPLTTSQRALYERLARACGIKDDDPLWTAMVVLGHYEILYEAVPARIEAAVKAQERVARENLEAHLAREHAAIAAKLASGIESIVANSLRDQVRLKLSLSLAGALMAVLALGACCFAAGTWTGRTRADADAVRRYAWVNTRAGQMAKRFVDSGAVASFERCREQNGRFAIDEREVATCSVR